MVSLFPPKNRILSPLTDIYSKFEMEILECNISINYKDMDSETPVPYLLHGIYFFNEGTSSATKTLQIQSVSSFIFAFLVIS